MPNHPFMTQVVDHQTRIAGKLQEGALTAPLAKVLLEDHLKEALETHCPEGRFVLNVVIEKLFGEWFVRPELSAINQAGQSFLEHTLGMENVYDADTYEWAHDPDRRAP